MNFDNTRGSSSSNNNSSSSSSSRRSSRRNSGSSGRRRHNNNNSSANHKYGTLANVEKESIFTRFKNAVLNTFTRKRKYNTAAANSAAMYGGSRKTRKNMRIRRTRRTSSKRN